MSLALRLTWSGRFADPATEAAFLSAILPDAKALGRLIVFSVMILDAVFVVLDAANFGLTRAGVMAVGLRLLTILWSVGCWRWLGHVTLPPAVDRLLGVWASVLIGVNMGMLWALPGNHTGAAAAFAVGVVLCYLLPVRLEWRGGLGGGLTVLFLATLVANGRPDTPKHLLTDTAVGFGMANGVGVVVGRWLAIARRRQYAALTALERTSAELRTLRGLLPICSCCKSIRDDAGGWHRMEAFIQDRTGARFTHGICPSCMASEYGITMDSVTDTPTVDRA